MPDPRSPDGEQMTTASVETASPESSDRRNPGVVDHDDRLILWMLELAPAKRLEALQNFVDGVVALRHARKITE